MKKVIISLAIVAATLSGCTSSKQLLEDRRAYVSWIAFCANRGYSINDNTGETINEYLDTWCGSVDEETAFINAGVKPY